MSEQNNGYEIVTSGNENKTVSQENTDTTSENGFVVDASSQVTNIQAGEVRVESKTLNFDGTVLGPGSFDGATGERALAIAEESGKALVRKMDSEVRVNDALTNKINKESAIVELKGEAEAEVIRLTGEATKNEINSRAQVNQAKSEVIKTTPRNALWVVVGMLAIGILFAYTGKGEYIRDLVYLCCGFLVFCILDMWGLSDVLSAVGKKIIKWLS